MSPHPGDAPRVLLVHDGLVAVHKPSGLRVHRADDDGVPDLGSWLEANQPGLRPCHRLDLQTSGIVLCAATREARAEVGRWLQEGKVQKRYEALVYGVTPRKGRIAHPLQDARRRRPLRAVTRYRRLEWFERFTHLEVFPETGRKHQIRRHLHDKGFPVVGDGRYKAVPFRKVPAFPGRLWLHAAGLVLPDGTTVADPLPPELLTHLEVLRRPPPEPAPAGGD